MAYTIDIDTGGTFTDGLIADHAGETVRVVKVPSTPHDPTVALLDCVAEAARQLDLAVPDLLRDTLVLRYANTIATNAVIQRRGAKVGVILAAGHPRPDWLVEDDWISADMIEYAGSGGALPAFQSLADRGAQAVIVGMPDPADELAAKRAIRQEYPGQYLGATPVFTTSEVADGDGAPARLNAAFLAAYVHHHLASYLHRAQDRLHRQGLRRPLLVVHSSGGASRVARTHALNTYNSGPASGLLGAGVLARRYGIRHAITLDMGGTSVDLGVLVDGAVPADETSRIAGLDVDLPALRVHAVGGAGGSIVTVDEAGVLRVGPDSAGARPGPACFGLGGRQPTVTDADLLLGHLDPDHFLGGRMRLDPARARTAMEPVAERLGLSLDEAVWRVKETVDGMCAASIADIAAADGLAAADVAGATCVVYGGAGPVHAAGILAAAGIRAALMTPYSAVFSAYGSSGLDVAHAYSRRVDGGSAVEAARELLSRARRDMAGEGFRDIALTVAATRVGGDAVEVADAEELAGLGDVTRVDVRAAAAVPHIEFRPSAPGDPDPEAARRGERDAYWGPEHGRVPTPAYDRGLLRPGHRVTGPALVDGADTTTVVPPGFALTVDEYGNETLTATP